MSRKQTTIQAVVNPDEAAALRSVAEGLGLSSSGLARRLINKGLADLRGQPTHGGPGKAHMVRNLRDIAELLEKGPEG